MGNELPWCETCCTQHVRGRGCPGNLLASGPERHGRRFVITQQSRVDHFGVLIAEAGEYWRARIFTYPNMLWSVPGQRGTMKFVAHSASEVEKKAIEFLRGYCGQRGWTIGDADAEATPGKAEGENASRLAPRAAKEDRHPYKLQIRFGQDKARLAATTANLSRGGLFIVTGRPVPVGSSLRMLLDFEHTSIPLLGEVAWVRREAQPGHPKGMGIQLKDPPAMYRRYVENIRAESEVDRKAPAE